MSLHLILLDTRNYIIYNSFVLIAHKIYTQTTKKYLNTYLWIQKSLIYLNNNKIIDISYLIITPTKLHSQATHHSKLSYRLMELNIWVPIRNYKKY